eukprot:Nk52_evm4s367 gene=Nk52_evmTU4s367
METRKGRKRVRGGEEEGGEESGKKKENEREGGSLSQTRRNNNNKAEEEGVSSASTRVTRSGRSLRKRKPIKYYQPEEEEGEGEEKRKEGGEEEEEEEEVFEEYCVASPKKQKVVSKYFNSKSKKQPGREGAESRRKLSATRAVASSFRSSSSGSEEEEEEEDKKKQQKKKKKKDGGSKGEGGGMAKKRKVYDRIERSQSRFVGHMERAGEREGERRKRKVHLGTFRGVNDQNDAEAMLRGYMGDDGDGVVIVGPDGDAEEVEEKGVGSRDTEGEGDDVSPVKRHGEKCTNNKVQRRKKTNDMTMDGSESSSTDDDAMGSTVLQAPATKFAKNMRKAVKSGDASASTEHTEPLLPSNTNDSSGNHAESRVFTLSPQRYRRRGNSNSVAGKENDASVMARKSPALVSKGKRAQAQDDQQQVKEEYGNHPGGISSSEDEWEVVGDLVEQTEEGTSHLNKEELELEFVSKGMQPKESGGDLTLVVETPTSSVSASTNNNGGSGKGAKRFTKEEKMIQVLIHQAHIMLLSHRLMLLNSLCCGEDVSGDVTFDDYTLSAPLQALVLSVLPKATLKLFGVDWDSESFDKNELVVKNAKRFHLLLGRFWDIFSLRENEKSLSTKVKGNGKKSIKRDPVKESRGTGNSLNDAIDVDSDNFNTTGPGKESIEQIVKRCISSVNSRQVECADDAVLLFLCACRDLGIKTRLVGSLGTVDIKPKADSFVTFADFLKQKLLATARAKNRSGVSIVVVDEDNVTNENVGVKKEQTDPAALEQEHNQLTEENISSVPEMKVDPADESSEPKRTLKKKGAPKNVSQKNASVASKKKPAPTKESSAEHSSQSSKPNSEENEVMGNGNPGQPDTSGLRRSSRRRRERQLLTYSESDHQRKKKEKGNLEGEGSGEKGKKWSNSKAITQKAFVISDSDFEECEEYRVNTSKGKTVLTRRERMKLTCVEKVESNTSRTSHRKGLKGKEKEKEDDEYRLSDNDEGMSSDAEEGVDDGDDDEDELFGKAKSSKSKSKKGGRRSSSSTRSKKPKASAGKGRGGGNANRKGGKHTGNTGKNGNSQNVLMDLFVELFDEETKNWVAIDVIDKIVGDRSLIRQHCSTRFIYVFCVNEYNMIKDITPKYSGDWVGKTLKERTDQKWVDGFIGACNRISELKCCDQAQQEDSDSDNAPLHEKGAATAGTRRKTGKRGVDGKGKERMVQEPSKRRKKNSNKMEGSSGSAKNAKSEMYKMMHSVEDEEITGRITSKEFPASIAGFKNHPLYALERHLLKYEVIYPCDDSAVVGKFKGEKIFPRDNVHLLHSQEKWLEQGKQLRDDASFSKVVKSRPWGGQEPKDLFLYGEWQVEDYVPPKVENGKVPRNRFGNVDMYKPSMLPQGGAHLKDMPGIARVAKKLNVDYANAHIGFEYHKKRCTPTLDGIIVPEESAPMLVDAWNEFQRVQEEKEEKKRIARVYGHWTHLTRSLLIKMRLKKEFGKEKL